ncbi:Gfo/Idh/MocA family protein [Rubrolithibacter danxiaensis]|uniref:Gfo/Idh/MocA family protein n=1 Tax=Rubrolithibacter danxiaensis TaxID=3390805 RepID=UPI003BF85FE5
MLKAGIIGLGDIALKAYLPVLANKPNIEFHLCSRNESKLNEAGEKFRIVNRHTTLESLINAGIKAAFVHAATDAHFEIVNELLLNGIHVYVDKPITMEYRLSKELVDLAEGKGLLLVVGFNRRFAPVYRQLKEMEEPSVIIMQKNRKSLPDSIRRFVVEDFIHVVDTLRFLFPYTIDQVLVHGKKRGNMLHHLVVQFVSKKGPVAIGIMDRDTGTTEEKIEVMNASEKRTVYNVADLYIEKERQVIKTGTSDWEPTLYKRGFEGMLDDFIAALTTNSQPMISKRDALLTHEICEYIVKRVEELE